MSHSDKLRKAYKSNPELKAACDAVAADTTMFGTSARAWATAFIERVAPNLAANHELVEFWFTCVIVEATSEGAKAVSEAMDGSR